jgi:tetratricopeptide (TPR) repeat protein
MARPLFAALGDRRGESAALIVLGNVARDRGDFRAAEGLFVRSRELAEEMGGEVRDVFVAVANHNLGSVALSEGDLERAVGRYRAALSHYRAAADPYGVALTELYLGFVAIEAGRQDDAAGLLARALPVFQEMRFLQYTAECLEGIAAVAHARGEAEEAARLLGAASAVRERTGAPPSPTLARVRERETVSTRAELGESAFAAAWADGRGLREDEAFSRAQRSVAG